ncbi:RhoGAP-domain-containing protein [Gloeophyllum trabeum ATCC 11539]|uniref:RhoGAP-domain-containing protein n=1 Tax=Gloeophyllum trabeum (strain ATCC 11539 / FP-39264 / Madison 617) TaxID=670483 RepID=S7Q9Z7_GLOTA|nr:RhoGAP-domain-containing protein [Gloeophyllum trabeum ATCC 11539]EPQ56726.1 RhoGAP-domain-containing protein [Gloeophyllum trabeum ATCC 11539]
MSDDGGAAAWANVPGSDYEHHNPGSPHSPTRYPYGGSLSEAHHRSLSRDSLTAEGSSSSIPLPPTKPTSPAPRSSSESHGWSSTTKWRESAQVTLERRDTYSTLPTEAAPSIVEPNFDENILRALCDLDCSVPLLLDRIKQSMVSCKEAATFLRKRAAIEEEYGRNMQKLARTSSDVYATADAKAGSFVHAWQMSMKIHEVLAENRLKFAQRLNEMSEELLNLIKEVDKNRKQTKDLASRYERALQDSESITEKSKSRFDMTAEELERLLLQKEGESFKENAVQLRSPGGGGKRVIGKVAAKGGLLLKGKNPGNLARQEDDVRARMSQASDTYRKAVTETQTIRQEYFNFQLPRILRALKECNDEIDLGTQYHLSRYAFIFETVVLGDGTTLSPIGIEDGPGLKGTIETIDNRSDFKVYMQNYAYAHGGANYRGPRREGPAEQGFVPPLLNLGDRSNQQQQLQSGYTSGSSPGASTSAVHDRGRPTFGVDLAEQMARDNVEVPPIMEKCCEAIEKYGLRSQGIYRISGTVTKVNRLKEKLDKDLDSVNLDAEEWSSDINNVTSVLKLWLRELPDPLFTQELHQGFIDAAKIENDRLRHIRLHERVNDLPDANYATLKYLMGHLHRIVEYETVNQMSVSNLAIVFGPTLFGQNASGQMADASWQNKAIETILEHYADIFVDEADGA